MADEFRAWGIPERWRKWLMAGPLAALVIVIFIQQMVIADLRKSIKDDRADRVRRDELIEEMAKRAFDEKLSEAKREIRPEIEEVKKAVDSTKQQ